MTAINDRTKPAEVITQFTADGKIIPIRIKLQDDDGAYQTYSIKGYKELTHYDCVFTYACKISVFNRIRIIKLIYQSHDCKWYTRIDDLG